MWLFNSNKIWITSDEFDELFKYASYDGHCGMSLGPNIIDKEKFPPAQDKWTIAKNKKQYEIIKKVIDGWTKYLKNEVEKEQKKIKNRPKFKSPKSASETVEQIVKGASIMDIDSVYIMWIDWKQDEKSIIDYVNKFFINGGINYIVESNGDITVEKADKRFFIKHIGDCSDIDKTLIAIQKCIEMDYQVLYLKESDGDTLAFTVLTYKEWENIKKKYIDKINRYFEPIKDDIKLFS